MSGGFRFNLGRRELWLGASSCKLPPSIARNGGRIGVGNRKTLLTGVAIGAGALLVVAAIVGLIVVYAGAYNVAASEGHTAFGRWALDTTMHNSVEGRAENIAAPPLTAQMVRAGARPYKAMCQHCHAGPGVQRAGWAEGLLPTPPHLTKAATEWQPNELFWIVKHGIKMSGMPSFGETHDDAALWNLVASVNALPAMPAEQYAAMGNAAPRNGGSTSGSGHGPPGHHN